MSEIVFRQNNNNILVPSLPGMDFDQTIYAQIFRFILGSICIFGNIFILCLFWRYKKLRKAPYNVLVALLAVADLLIGIGVLIRGSYGMYTSTNGIHTFTKRSCQLANIVSGFGITSNQAIIIGVAADRLTAVWRPTSYSKNFSMIIPSISFVIAAIYTILIGYISVVGSNPDDLITVCSMAPASTQLFTIIWATTSGTQAILVNAIYVASLILVKKRLSLIGGSSGTSSTSRKVFIYVTLILVTQIIFWEIPIAFLIISMIFQLPSGTKAYVTLSIGFGSALSAAIGTLICIFKNHELREYTKAFFGKPNSVVGGAGHSLKNAQTTTVGITSRRHTVIVTLT